MGVQSNRGVKKGNYHVLRESAMASMLVELGFLSNDLDNRLFDQHLEDYAASKLRLQTETSLRFSFNPTYRAVAANAATALFYSPRAVSLP